MLHEKWNMFSKAEQNEHCLLTSFTVHINVIHLATYNTVMFIKYYLD